jgi:SgrR family transcriptional regulator
MRISRREWLLGMGAVALLPRLARGYEHLTRPYTWAIVYPPRTLDPRQAFDLPSERIVTNLYESLVVRHKQNMQPVPKLASRWDRLIHSGQSVGWRFFLEPQARFWDGRPVTAPDVVYSLKNAVVMTKLKPPNPGVEVLDPHTLVIKYGPPRQLLHALTVAFIVPEGLYEEQDVEQMPMGSGPFQLETRTPDRIVLRRFDNYYGTKPLQKKIAYLVVPDKMKHPGLCEDGLVLVQP